MEYEYEELVPILDKLARKYAGFDNSSISYEKAEQLLGSILFCIRETEYGNENGEALAKRQSAIEAYETGLQLAKNKVRDAIEIYNKTALDFRHYGNRQLKDLFYNDIPHFFKYYDVNFNAQDSVIDIIYPALSDISTLQGVDKIFELIKCIDYEQRFFKPLPSEYITSVLAKYDAHYESLTENICGIILTSIVSHILIGKPLTEYALSDKDYMELKKVFLNENSQQVKHIMDKALHYLIEKYYNGDIRLYDYLSASSKDIIRRLQSFSETDTLKFII